MKENRTATNEILGRVLTAVVIFVSAALIVISAGPMVFGYRSYGVNSQTMNPTIGRGSLVIVEKVTFDDILVGDILTFTDEQTGESFTHRVELILADKRQLITKGDANDYCDPMTTSFDCVAGRVVRVIPLLGYPSIFFSSFLGRLIVIAVYVFLASIEIEIFRSKKGRANPNEA